MTKSEQIAALRQVCDGVVDAVKAGGAMGAPGGVIYATLMAHGCSLEQYESIMSALVRAGRLTRQGHLYRVA